MGCILPFSLSVVSLIALMLWATGSLSLSDESHSNNVSLNTYLTTEFPQTPKGQLSCLVATLAFSCCYKMPILRSKQVIIPHSLTAQPGKRIGGAVTCSSVSVLSRSKGPVSLEHTGSLAATNRMTTQQFTVRTLLGQE